MLITRLIYDTARLVNWQAVMPQLYNSKEYSKREEDSRWNQNPRCRKPGKMVKHVTIKGISCNSRKATKRIISYFLENKTKQPLHCNYEPGQFVFADRAIKNTGTHLHSKKDMTEDLNMRPQKLGRDQKEGLNLFLGILNTDEMSFVIFQTSLKGRISRCTNRTISFSR